MQIAFIDHYDSFSFNVLDWLHRNSPTELQILRITAGDETGLARLKNNPIPSVISPGPGRPEDYPLTMKLLETLVVNVPVFGVCLGHQMMASIFGGQITRAKHPWHGTASSIRIHQKNWLTKDLPMGFRAISYNSLVAHFPESTTHPWHVVATNEYDENMMMTHRSLPLASVQFHPESFGSEVGHTIAKNFLAIAASWAR